MPERTDEVELDPDEAEAQAAMEEAQSVLDDVETSTGTGDSGGLLGGGGGGGGSAAEPTTKQSTDESSGSLLPSLSMPSPSLSAPDPGELFSSKWFGVGLVGSVVGLLGGGFVLSLLGSFGGYVGLLAVAFLLGLLDSESHYFEMAMAAAIPSAAFALLRSLTFAFASGSAVQMLAIGGVIGLIAGTVGYYFGRDLRSGLDRDVGGGGGRDDDVPDW